MNESPSPQSRPPEEAYDDDWELDDWLIDCTNLLREFQMRPLPKYLAKKVNELLAEAAKYETWHVTH